ncbi:Transcription termination factor Rho [Caenorhabditis elegans]|uniref:Transcription termination factor Rho n=1 Tax=Caenorhabditis elegans TaxID=6239 RepID=Q9XV57_CAEEL|nr:Transcription termination factor Rho [Caenorhabditis elegans]NP_507967.2 Transcription termination factor Rho [Caenorhabditis elegans]CAB04188.2 Transcription termination factor Rho [Caenorhabditis elegans]CAP19332.1 Transcription termination factor Rho [Caenorhabditis elegans]|eukprot:NP_001122933.1 Uncharacterized protein CELE_F26F2.9 [Caenorhabditis elegans]
MSDNNTLRMAEMLDKQNSRQHDFMKRMMEMNYNARLSDQARDDRNAIRSENNLKEVNAGYHIFIFNCNNCSFNVVHTSNRKK